MEMQFKNEIKKLADIVVWADNWITELKDGLTGEQLSGTLTGKYVKEFETVKKVVLESMERHSVYTNALNKDIADKAAKIEILEKEIEGRKAGYYNLKDRLDTAREIEDHWKQEYETLTTNFSAKSVELNEANNKINDLKEEIKKLNKCIMNKNESINTGNEAIINLRKEIGAHEEENKKLENRIKELHKKDEDRKDHIKELESEYVHVTKYNKIVHSIDLRVEENKKLRKEIDGLREDVKYWKEAFETQATSLAEVRKCNDSLVDTLNKSSDKVDELEKQVKYLKKELNETCTTKELDLKNHQKRDMALVDELAKKNDEIKKLKESIEEWKNQERIRTNQLRATERKVEELWKEIEKFTKGEDDDHGKSGFKRYIEYLIEEEERAVPERFKERLNKEITEIFTKEEETEVKGVGRTNSGRYPWGAKVNDIPCGEDAIE